MLSDLRVQNFGVIEDVELVFGPGMTVLTGETGAGKTLLVEALQLVLGGRAQPGSVRTGATEALIEARFLMGESERILGRSIPEGGRSRGWVDGRMVPVSVLNEAATSLVDIHGQHGQQSLLQGSSQRGALDGFGGIDPSPRTAAKRAIDDLDRMVAALGGDPQARARQVALLGHEIAEIEAAGVRDAEEDMTLREEEDRLADMGAIRLALGEALELLVGSGQSGVSSVEDLMGQLTGLFKGRAALAEWERTARDLGGGISELASALRHASDTWEDDPERLEQVQERRRLLSDLRRRYGPELGDVLKFAEHAKEELAALLGAEERAATLDAERAVLVTSHQDLEQKLEEARRKVAPTFSEALTERLESLAMQGARFEAEVDGVGGDHVRFLLAANPGETPQPLSRVASGGELSRTMLALTLCAGGGPETVVFDEVDAGVGGSAAVALAEALRDVASDRQVLVVTHLAAVAAFADHHVVVRKEVRGERTITLADKVVGPERVTELSRMLSGQPDSTTAQAHAQELLLRAGGHRNSTRFAEAVD